jgi:hypothetical protein
VIDDLVAWYRQQLDEDEAMARDADLGEAEWYSVRDLERGHREGGAGLNDFDARFIARHDPSGVVRDVEAKRLIIDTAVWFRDRAAQVEGQRVYDMDDMRENLHLEVTARVLANTLSVLAAALSARPGYREEWRP